MATADTEVTCYEELAKRFEYLFEEPLVRDMCHHGALRRIPAHTALMEIGQEISHMPLVVSGALKVMTQDEQGDELLLYYLELGDTCAMTLNCCSKKTKSTVSAMTEEDSRVLFIPVEKMEAWMVEYRSWRDFVLESYHERLQEMLQAIDQLAFHDMEDRLRTYLRDKALVHHGGELKTTHHQIARDLHSSRVVISRLMKKLEKVGFLEQYRNRVVMTEFKESNS